MLEDDYGRGLIDDAAEVLDVAPRLVADIDALQRILQIQEQEARDGITDYSSDEQFHLRVAQATQNSVLAKSVKYSIYRSSKFSNYI